jgi:hypothetical protein
MKMKHVWDKCFWLISLVCILCPGGWTTAQTTAQTATVLLTDISGSMEERDISGLIKLDAAKSAIGTYVDIVEVESRNYSNMDLLSLVTFCDSADQRTDFTTDFNAVRAVVQPLVTCGSTNMVSGIHLSDNLVRAIKTQNNNIATNIILLTDGLPTASPSGASDLQQEVLDALPSLNVTGTCLYIVPLGNPNAGGDGFVDLAFLEQMDAVVNCGRLFDFVSPAELQQLYLSIRLQIVNVNVQSNTTLTVNPNQTVTLPPITVQPNVPELRVDTLVLNNGAVTVRLTDPNGQVVDANYPGARSSTIGNVIQWIIDNPIAGQWRAEVLGMGAATTQFTTSISTGTGSLLGGATPNVVTQSNDTTLLGIILILLLLGGGVIAAVLYNQNNRAKIAGIPYADVPTGQQGFLVFLSGPRVGQQLPISSSTFSIGRRGGNHLQLQDTHISREHARILLREGNYLIQDLNSQSGTFVNNMQIQAAHPLRHSDQIRIGRISMQFIYPT